MYSSFSKEHWEEVLEFLALLSCRELVALGVICSAWGQDESAEGCTMGDSWICGFGQARALWMSNLCCAEVRILLPVLCSCVTEGLRPFVRISFIGFESPWGLGAPHLCVAEVCELPALRDC